MQRHFILGILVVMMLNTSGSFACGVNTKQPVKRVTSGKTMKATTLNLVNSSQPTDDRWEKVKKRLKNNNEKKS